MFILSILLKFLCIIVLLNLTMYEFEFKPFNKMTRADYETVGFKSGLEIHQQLLTEKKLFCRCPAGKYSTEYDAEILRHMRPTLSELGEYDGTALMEFKTRKNITYRIKRETVCTYEMDDTPPFLINDEALDAALSIGLLYDCNLVDELHIIRKQYLDGSIPTGFQRTAIFALNGKVPYKGREINVMQMSIEEDSCREVSDKGHDRIYLTDRLGMPLIETVTAPEMFEPIEVAEVASICSRLVRSSGRVRRGIGAARQDVNVSVTGGTRIEIKGVPRIGLIPLLTYNEARRQWNLLRLRAELHRRKITSETFSSRIVDITRYLSRFAYLPLKEAAEKGQKASCVILKGYAGLLHWETQTGTYFAREISDRIRVIACLTDLPNIVHSDSKGENLSAPDWSFLNKTLEATSDDTLVLVWGDENDVKTACSEIIIRAKEATIGIPSETRQALEDGTNGFERILPGAERMYPDTDLPPIRVTLDRKKRLEQNLPEKFWETEKKLSDAGVPADLIREMSNPAKSALFFEFFPNRISDAKLISKILANYPKRLKKKFRSGIQPETEIYKIILENLADGKIIPSTVFTILANYSINGELILTGPLDNSAIEDKIREKADEFREIIFRNPEKKTEVISGKILAGLNFRVAFSRVIQSVEGFKGI